MSKRRRTPTQTSHVTNAVSRDAGERLRPLWLGGVVALLVATPLLPSEAAAAGLGNSWLMAWFLLATAFAVTSAVQGSLRMCHGKTDIAVLIFVALHTISALVLADAGQPRQTLNMLWTWVGFGIAYFSVRQVVRTPEESRGLIAVMMAVAVCLSMHGYHQYFYSTPEARRQYEADRDGTLARAGLDAPQDSIAREQFENRLYSTEPMATFTLANSLAGFLAPWLLCAVGIGALNWSMFRSRVWLGLVAGLSSVLIAGCFILTKSRTATLAVLIGFSVLAVYGRRSGWRPGWKFAVTLAGALFITVILAIFVGGIDVQVLTESSMSLLYRVQYWRASFAMIADSPWFGCGPGNFQETYTAYKLPEASETIADPHNFLIEIWSTSGTPAMLAFLGVLACFAFEMLREEKVTSNPHSDSGDSACIRAIYWGAFLGVPFAFILGLAVNYVPDFAVLIVGLPVAVVVAVGWLPWVRNGQLPTIVLITAAIALLVNLSAAGGISFAGVSVTFWLIVATAINHSNREQMRAAVSKRTAMTIAIVISALTVLYWYSTFVPTANLATRMAQARDAQSKGRLDEADELLLSAAAADSYSVEPWQVLAQLRFRVWLEHPDANHETAFVEAAHEALAHSRRSRGAQQAYGDWYLQAYRTMNERRFLEEAIVGYRSAVRLYPNYNYGHAQLSWALHLAGRATESQSEAAEALRLDELNPHREQKLNEQNIFDLPRRFGSQIPHPPDVNAEQLMGWLRTGANGPIDNETSR
ncbi:MAG: O-antigen ligase family protein [Planctomycetaceae bacterium]|nr:O-antigen ligase family protein [Planctomycetales bacterium]MCB9924076.1 O-antigen ligase family protein [Planctomycetaceae bacterium]